MSNLPSLSLDTVKANFLLALTQEGYQKLVDKVDSFVLNEDSVNEASDLLTKLRKFENVVKEIHKKEKEPYLNGGRIVDAAKNDITLLIAGVISKIEQPYVKLCKEIDERKRQVAAEKARVDAIKEGIEKNLLYYSQQVANCTTDTQLVEIERKFNLEKTRKSTYAEFYDEAMEKFAPISDLIKVQKENIRSAEKLKEEERLAREANDDSKVIELQAKQDALESKIEETKIVVQETAINTATAPSVIVAEPILPTIKARREVLKCEVVDIKALERKMPEMGTWTVDEDKLKGWLKEKKSDKSMDNKDEEIINGVRFYWEKTY